jgi:cation:H+ antiporter
LVWLKFIVCAAIIIFAGTKAARYADTIAERTGLGRIWVGLLLLAVMTSMPEMVTGISSVTLAGVEGSRLPDLGLGTLLGSCIFNLCILVVLDVLSRDGPIFNRVSRRQMATASLAILLISVLGGTVLVGGGWAELALGWVGISGMLIFGLYLAGVWSISHLERGRRLPSDNAAAGESSLKVIWVKFGIAAVAVIGGGIWLSFIGDEIAVATGWGATFVGSLFLAVATSLPELIVALTAFRLGAIDLAVADILGANILDISYTFILDVFYSQGAILSLVSKAHVVTSAVIMAMNLVVILGLRFQQQRKTFFVVSWYGVVLIALYICGAYSLYSSGAG